jgi:hypothetical protein
MKDVRGNFKNLLRYLLEKEVCKALPVNYGATLFEISIQTAHSNLNWHKVDKYPRHLGCYLIHITLTVFYT